MRTNLDSHFVLARSDRAIPAKIYIEDSYNSSLIYKSDEISLPVLQITS